MRMHGYVDARIACRDAGAGMLQDCGCKCVRRCNMGDTVWRWDGMDEDQIRLSTVWAGMRRLGRGCLESNWGVNDCNGAELGGGWDGTYI